LFLLKSKKATGLDGMTARLLKDAAPVIAKPITYIINLTISTGETQRSESYAYIQER